MRLAIRGMGMRLAIRRYGNETGYQRYGNEAGTLGRRWAVNAPQGIPQVPHSTLLADNCSYCSSHCTISSVNRARLALIKRPHVATLSTIQSTLLFHSVDTLANTEQTSRAVQIVQPCIPHVSGL